MELLKVGVALGFLLVGVVRGQAGAEDDYDIDYVDNHSGGFGDGYSWLPTLEEAIKEGKNHKLPVMLIVHKAWCARSSDLKKIIGSSKAIQKKSKNFVMVNTTEDDDDRYNVNIAPDGIYFPRIIFIYNGKIMKLIINPDSDFKHYYNKEKSVLDAMDRALDKLKYSKRL